MTSSPNTHMQTSVPFLNWCVYAVMRFLESLMKMDTIDVSVLFVGVSSSCETYDLNTVPPNSLESALPRMSPVFTTDPLNL